MNANTSAKATCCLLDTSVQVDRFKMPTRAKSVNNELQAYSIAITTGIALVEFKATLIQECIAIHNSMRATKSFCGSIVDNEDLRFSVHRYK